MVRFWSGEGDGRSTLGKGAVCMKLHVAKQAGMWKGRKGASRSAAQGLEGGRNWMVGYDQIVGTSRTIERLSFLFSFFLSGKRLCLSMEMIGVQTEPICKLMIVL